MGVTDGNTDRRSKRREAEPLHRPGPMQGRALDAEAIERRRIGQDLHDGTQQRLVVLLVGLSALGSLIHDDHARAVGLARRLENEAQKALEELRAIVHGIQPPELTDFGLVQALHEVARACPIPTTVITHEVVRYDRATEDAIYFTCREALQNTLKHARTASVTVTLLDHGDQLEFEVEDNGPGFDAALPGTGLPSMHQRIEALGGSLTVESAPGAGTQVHAHLPLGHVTAGLGYKQ